MILPPDLIRMIFLPDPMRLILLPDLMRLILLTDLMKMICQLDQLCAIMFLVLSYDIHCTVAKKQKKTFYDEEAMNMIENKGLV